MFYVIKNNMNYRIRITKWTLKQKQNWKYYYLIYLMNIYTMSATQSNLFIWQNLLVSRHTCADFFHFEWYCLQKWSLRKISFPKISEQTTLKIEKNKQHNYFGLPQERLMNDIETDLLCIICLLIRHCQGDNCY